MEMCSTRHIFDNEEYQTRRYTLRNRRYLKYKVQYKVRRNIFITRDKMFAATNRYHIQWLIILMNALCNRRFVLFRASTRYVFEDLTAFVLALTFFYFLLVLLSISG